MKNTERLLSFQEVKENREEIVPRISEGCESLERLLNNCIDLDIPTTACCAGHNILDEPYISLHYNNSTSSKINGFLNRLDDVFGIKIMFSTYASEYSPFDVTIYTKPSNRDKVFDVISDSLENREESEYLNSSLDISLQLAYKMDENMDRISNVTVFNKRLQRKYMARVYGESQYADFLETYHCVKKTSPEKISRYFYKNEDDVRDVTAQLNAMFSSSSSTINDISKRSR